MNEEGTLLALAHLDKIVQDARLTAVNDPKNPAKAESRVHTFFAAVRQNGNVLPVKLQVKEYAPSGMYQLPQNVQRYVDAQGAVSEYGKLYDVVALEVLGAEKETPGATGEVPGKNAGLLTTPGAAETSGATGNGSSINAEGTTTPGVSEVSVAELLGLVNGDARRYIPENTANAEGATVENDGKLVLPKVEETDAPEQELPDIEVEVDENEPWNTAKVWGEESGIVENEHSAKLDPVIREFYQTIGKQTGTKIIFTDTAARMVNGKMRGINGEMRTDGVMVIALDAVSESGANPLFVVGKHEITHRMKQLARNEYGRYCEAAKKLMALEKGIDVRALEQQYMDEYGLDREGARDEIAADFTEKLLTDEKTLHKFLGMEDNRTSFQKLIEIVKDFFKKISAAFDSKTAEMDADMLDMWKAFSKEMKEAVELWEKAYAAAAQNAQDAISRENGSFEDMDGDAAQKNTTDGGVQVQYSLKAFEDGARFVDVESDQERFAGLSLTEMNKLAKSIIKEKYSGSVVGIDNAVFVNGKSAEKYVYYPPGTEREVIEAKARASTELDNLIEAGTNFRTVPDGADGHVHPDAIGGFSYFDTIFKVGTQYYKGIINIKNIGKGRLLWGVTKTENITQDIHDSYGENPTVIFLRDVSMRMISRPNSDVKGQMSVKTDDSISLPKTTEHSGEMEALRKEIDRLSDPEYQRLVLVTQRLDALNALQKEVDRLQKRLERLEQKASGEEKRETASARKEKPKPVAPSKPIISTRDLRSGLLNLFSIPQEQRQEMGEYIDRLAEKILQTGEVTDADRKFLFDLLYAEGVMTAEADDYYAMGREIVKGRKIYVNDSVKEEFGEDWNEFRRRAFAAGVYFVNDSGAMAPDMVNQELAEMFPYLFSEETTDSREILEAVVKVAEEGRDQKMSLAEYSAMLAGHHEISMDEFLAEMEGKVEQALRIFAEKAKLEVKLRDRTGVQIAKERAQQRERAEKAQKERYQRELQQKTLKQLRWLKKEYYKLKPEDLAAGVLPPQFKNNFEEVLSDLDLYAVSAADEMHWSEKYQATWRDIVSMARRFDEQDNFFMTKDLERIVSRVKLEKISDYDPDMLQNLYNAALAIRKAFQDRNKLLGEIEYEMLASAYQEIEADFRAVPRDVQVDPETDMAMSKGKIGDAVEAFFNDKTLTPTNKLRAMAGWKPDGAWNAMIKMLVNGEIERNNYAARAQLMLRNFMETHKDWFAKADGQGKHGIWYEVQVPELISMVWGNPEDGRDGVRSIFGETHTVYMTPMQKVQLYLESKGEDNLRHMMGGRTFVNKSFYSKGKRDDAFAHGKTIRLAPETVKALVKGMTPVELELARLLENYYNVVSKAEINRVSNVLYGYDKAMGTYYAPIFTDKSYNQHELGVFDFTPESVGNMNFRQVSKTPTMNLSAIDAFEKSVDMTANFVGMAIPLRNWNQLTNWHTKDGTFQTMVGQMWGDPGKKYIKELLDDLMGRDGKTSTFADQMFSNYISSVFGANLSIVLKQLGSVPHAASYLGFENMPVLHPRQLKKVDKELINIYTQMLAHRMMGYATPETKVLKENPGLLKKNKTLNFLFGGGAITWMDGAAAGWLWPWAENKVAKEYPRLQKGTKEEIKNGQSLFYKKVAEVFHEAVMESQSASDIMHQSVMRRSDKAFHKALTMFRSDSAQAYNTLRRAVGEAQYLKRTGAKKDVIKKANARIGSSVLGIVMGNIWAEIVTFGMAALKGKLKRYKDEEEELTATSIFSEMMMGFGNAIAGLLPGGDILAEAIGTAISGERWYGIDTPGIEQVENLFTDLWEAGKGIVALIPPKDVRADGDVEMYYKQNKPKIRGAVRDIAVALCKYFGGIPAENVEAYLLGAVRIVSPELTTMYEDAVDGATKANLKGLKGKALEQRIDDIFALRTGGVRFSGEAVSVVADLYEAGFTAAVPSATPASFTVDGEEFVLTETQRQKMDKAWTETVPGMMEDLVKDASFLAATEEEQARALKKLYDYGREKGKAAVIEGYELPSGAAELEADDDPAVWLTATSVAGNDGAEGFLRIAELPLQESMKREMLQDVMSEKQMEGLKIATGAGLTVYEYCNFLYQLKAAGVKKKDDALVFIDKMSISSKKKDALYFALGYSGRDLKKAPWN